MAPGFVEGRRRQLSRDLVDILLWCQLALVLLSESTVSRDRSTPSACGNLKCCHRPSAPVSRPPGASRQSPGPYRLGNPRRCPPRARTACKSRMPLRSVGKRDANRSLMVAVLRGRVSRGRRGAVAFISCSSQKVNFKPSWIRRASPEPTIGLPTEKSGVRHPQPKLVPLEGSAP